MAAPTGLATAWGVRGASVRGNAHVRDGTPNQDAWASWSAPVGSGLPAIVTVADGHGGARHFRSDTGARLAVEASVDVLRALAPRIDAASEADRAQLVAIDVPTQIVARWTERVRQHLVQSSVTDDEWQRVAAAEGPIALDAVRADPVLAYGTTVLAAMVTERCVVLAQIGDGDILAVAPDGRTTRPLPADERLIGNRTTSLCQSGAQNDFRVVVLAAERVPLDLLLLATDGYANSFKTDADFLQVGHDLFEMIRTDGVEAVAQRLPGFLAHASENGSGDDITLGLLHRAHGALMPEHAPAAPARSEPWNAPTGGQMPPPRAKGELSQLRAQLGEARRQAHHLKLGAAAAIVAAAVAVGWVAQDRLFGVSSGAGANVAADPGSKGGEKKGGGKTPEPAAKSNVLAPPPGAAMEPAASAVKGDEPVRVVGVRANAVKGGVDVRITLRVEGTGPRRCALEAVLYGPKGKALGTGRQQANLDTGVDWKTEVYLAVPKLVPKDIIGLGTASVTVDCGADTKAVTSVPITAPAKSTLGRPADIVSI